MKKRLLAVFMALCLIVGLLPVSVLAVGTENITMISKSHPCQR